jgi:hypothetical protein
VALALTAEIRASSGWEVLHGTERDQLIAHLRREGNDRVSTGWTLSYFIRFMTDDRVLCSSYEPPRYPDLNARVDFAESAVILAERPRHDDGVATTQPPGFRIRPAPNQTPREVADAFSRLDLDRTLFPHFEPFPLLEKDDWDRDWRGWPYQRPLKEFTAIVWEPDRISGSHVDAGVIERALTRLEASGEFVAVADWKERKILLRSSEEQGIARRRDH